MLNLPNTANSSNTWLTYTINWQPDHVSWAINGVPVLKRMTGQVVKWAGMEGRPFE
jgi:beta-glucanase (GH16 family)